MADRPDVNNRLKGLRIPIETCVKYERLVGVKQGEDPTPSQRLRIGKMMVSAVVLAVQNVNLSAADYRWIAEEVEKNSLKLKEKSVKKD